MARVARGVHPPLPLHKFYHSIFCKAYAERCMHADLVLHLKHASSGGCTPRTTRAMARGSAQKIAEEAQKIAEEE